MIQIAILCVMANVAIEAFKQKIVINTAAQDR